MLLLASVSLLLSSLLTFAVRRLFLLLSASGRVVLFLLDSTTGGGCSHEYVRIGLLQLAEHFLPVLSLRKTAREQFY